MMDVGNRVNSNKYIIRRKYDFKSNQQPSVEVVATTPTLPSIIQLKILKYIANTNIPNSQLCQIYGLVCWKWFGYVSNYIDSQSRITDRVISSIIPHLVAKRNIKYSLIQSINTLVFDQYDNISFDINFKFDTTNNNSHNNNSSNNNNNNISSITTHNRKSSKDNHINRKLTKDEQSMVERFLFSKLDCVQFNLCSNTEIGTNFVSIVDAIKRSQQHQQLVLQQQEEITTNNTTSTSNETSSPFSKGIKSFVYFNRAAFLLGTVTSFDSITKNLTELSIQCDHINAQTSTTLATFIKERRMTLEKLTLSLFNIPNLIVGLFEDVFSVVYPKVKYLHFGSMDYMEPFNWLLLQSSFPMLSEIGVYWRNLSLPENGDYQESLVTLLSTIKNPIYLRTSLILTQSMINLIPKADKFLKLKFRIIKPYDTPVLFNPALCHLSLTFMAGFVFKKEFITQIFQGLADNNPNIKTLTIWDLSIAHAEQLCIYLRSETASKSLEELVLSIRGSVGDDYSELANVVGSLQSLKRLEFKGINTQQQLQDIKSIHGRSRSIQSILLILPNLESPNLECHDSDFEMLPLLNDDENNVSIQSTITTPTSNNNNNNGQRHHHHHHHSKISIPFCKSQ